MTEQITTDEQPESSGLSRRRLLAGTAAGTVAVWAAPAVTTMSRAVGAPGSGQPCTKCAGDFCGGQTDCSAAQNFSCACAQRVDGQGCFCYQVGFCQDFTSCTQQSDCSAGLVCTHTCCDGYYGSGTSICVPACNDPQHHVVVKNTKRNERKSAFN